MENKLDHDRQQRVEKLTQQILEHPSLRESFEQMLALLNVEENSMTSADEAEMRVLALTRQMGQKLLQDWFIKKHAQCLEPSQQQTGVIRHGKKN